VVGADDVFRVWGSGEVVVGVSGVLRRVDQERITHGGSGEVVVGVVTRMRWRCCAFIGCR
jgi:hypothetical protein